jgi:hypothetical protein
MNDARSPEEIIRIPSTPSVEEQLIGQIHEPSELDEVTNHLDIPASLLNFHLATPIDLSSIGLGNVVHIPVQISEREGGRKSLYYLNPGEETLVGIYVTNQGIALRFMERVTGNSLPAQTDDIYSERITSRDGIIVFQSRRTLEIINPRPGGNPSWCPFMGRFHIIGDLPSPSLGGDCLVCSILWQRP